MNKITRKKPNYMKLFIIAYKNKLYGITINRKTYSVILGGRSNGKQRIIKELKGGER